MGFSHNLKVARKAMNLTQRELAGKLDVKHNTISNWEHGVSGPDVETLNSLCKILDVSADYLFRGEAVLSLNSSPFDQNEVDILRKFRTLNHNSKEAVKVLLDHFYLTENNIKKAADSLAGHAASRKPVLELIEGRISTQSVAAGFGTYLDEDNFEPITVLKNKFTKNAAFFVPVSGDSMEPRFKNGDVLIVEDIPVQNGEIGVFTLNGSGYVKICGKSTLISLNEKYPPIPMNEDIICNGKVTGILDPSWIIEEN